MKPHRLLALILTLATLVGYFPVMEQYTQSFKFVDEDEYIVVASLMNRGQKLYRDIATNHQPVTYILSAGLQRVAQPANMFMLLKRHREAVFLWSLAWAVILCLRFGMAAWPVVLVIEGVKYLVLGQAFLAESLAAYPLAYWYGAAIEQWFAKTVWREDFFLGLIAAGLVFLLLPLAAPLLLLCLARYVPLRGKGVGLLIAGAALVGGSVFALASPTDYFRETIHNNVTYTIPDFGKTQAPGGQARLFLLPILAFVEPPTLMSYWVMAISTLWFLTLGVWLYHKHWRRVVLWLCLYVVWGASNGRVYYPDRFFYEAFHILPWLTAGMLGGMLLFTRAAWQQYSPRWRRVAGGLLVVVFVVLLTFRGMPVRARIDTATEHYVQFNAVAQISQIINLIKQPGDRLMSLPNEVMTHWETGLAPATRMVTYYEWQFSPPENQQAFLQTIATNPPEFVQYFNDSSRFSPYMEELLRNRYKKLFSVNRTDGVMGLYVLDTRYQALPASAWKALKALPLTLEDVTTL